MSVKPQWNGEPPPNAGIWTGEIQRIATAATSSAATAITVPGRWFRFYASALCHIVIGGKTDLRPATATGADTCYPVQAGVWSDPVYVPGVFDSAADGTGTLYIRVIRNAADGSLFIAAAYPSSASRENVSVHWPTSTSTTTTSTSTTT